MFENRVKSLVEECLEKRQDLFLIDLNIASDNAIKIIIDGDHGVLVQDCVYVSRAVEHNLDREEQDFSIEVTSAGATSPLSHLRQYKKNIGKTLQVKTLDQEKFEGVLSNVEDSKITLNWKAREPKTVGKGKVTVKKEAVLEYNDIEQAKVKLKF